MQPIDFPVEELSLCFRTYDIKISNAFLFIIAPVQNTIKLTQLVLVIKYMQALKNGNIKYY